MLPSTTPSFCWKPFRGGVAPSSFFCLAEHFRVTSVQMPYLRFVRMLADAAPHHPVILAEAPHVALRLSGISQPVDALAHALAGVLRRGGFSGATFVAHSYGTFVASRMRQLYPEVQSWSH